MLRFTSNIDFPVNVTVGPHNLRLPQHIPVCTGRWTGCTVAAGESIQVGVEEVQYAYRRKGSRYRFDRWSDGGAIVHSHSVRTYFPDEGAELKLHVTEEYEVQVAAVGQGSVGVLPESADGYYVKGSTVNINAVPDQGWSFVQWNHGLDGSYPAHSVPIDRFLQVEALFTQNLELIPGLARTLTLPSTQYSEYRYRDENGLFVRVPPDATELLIQLEASTPVGDVDLYLKHGSGLDDHYERRADHASISPSGTESITISGDSDPPLRPGVYFIGIVTRTPFADIPVRVDAALTRGAALMPRVRASPRAFAFVSPVAEDPARQAITLGNDGLGTLHFEVTSDSPWLRAAPARGSVPAGQEIRLELAVSGAGLAPSHNVGKLLVRHRAAGAAAVPSTEAEVPVTYVALPSQ